MSLDVNDYGLEKRERDLSTSSLVFGMGFIAIEGERCFGCVSGVLLLRKTVFSSSIPLCSILENRVGQKGYVLSSIITPTLQLLIAYYKLSCVSILQPLSDLAAF